MELSGVIDGRFRGGYITRHYGDPANGVHSLQLELVQCQYMEETLPFDYDPRRAVQLQPLLRRLLERTIDWAEDS